MVEIKNWQVGTSSDTQGFNLGDLVRIQDGSVGVVTLWKYLKTHMADETWHIWHLPDGAPHHIDDVTRLHIGHVSDRDKRALVFPPRETPFTAETHDPTMWGGVPGPRYAVYKRLDGGVIVTDGGDIPAGVARSRAYATVGDAMNQDLPATIGEYKGPTSIGSFARVRAHDLRIDLTTRDIRLVKDLGHGTALVDAADVPHGKPRASFDADPHKAQKLTISSTYIGPSTERGFYSRINLIDLGTPVVPPAAPQTIDARIVKRLKEGLVIVRLGDVPPTAKRSSASGSVDDVEHRYLRGDGDDAYDPIDLDYATGPLSKSAHIGPDHFVIMSEWDLLSTAKNVNVRDLAPEVKAVPPPPKFGNQGRTYTFDTGKNPLTQTLGWRPTDLGGTAKAAAFDPVSPVMTIHDLMEHFPGDEYEVHAEYEAQGAMLWLRLEGGFFYGKNRNDITNDLIRDAFAMLFFHIKEKRLDTKDFNMVGPAPVPVTKMQLDTQLLLNELLYKAQQFIRSNYSGSHAIVLEESIVRGVPWIHHGFNRAAERYKGLDRARLAKMFKNAAEAIGAPRDGAKLKLSLDYEKYTATIEVASSVKG